MKQYRNDELLVGIAKIAKELREQKSPDLTQETVMSEIKILTEVSIHIGRIETAVNNITVSN